MMALDVRQCDFDDITLALYDSALGISGWNTAFEKIGSVFGTSNMTYLLYRHHSTIDILAVRSLNPEFAQYWLGEWAGKDRCPRLQYSLVSEGDFQVDYDFTEEAEITHSEYYHELGRRFDYDYSIGARAPGLVPYAKDLVFGYGYGFSKSHGHPQADELDLAHRLHEHVMRAVRVAVSRAHASVVENSSHQFAGLTGHGAIVVTADSRIVSVSPGAEKLLAGGDGLRLKGGRLTARLHCDSTRLEALVRSAAAFGSGTGGAPGGAMEVSRGPRAGRLSLVVAPVTRSGMDIFSMLTSGAVVYVSDPQAQSAVDERRLAALHKFTEAEARVAARFLLGMGIQEIAADIGVTVRTVRFHLHNIFAKAGVSSQTELMRCLKGDLLLRFQDSI